MNSPYERGLLWFCKYAPELIVDEENPALVAVDLMLRAGIEIDAEVMIGFAVYAQEQVDA